MAFVWPHLEYSVTNKEIRLQNWRAVLQRNKSEGNDQKTSMNLDSKVHYTIMYLLCIVFIHNNVCSLYLFKRVSLRGEPFIQLCSGICNFDLSHCEMGTSNGLSREIIWSFVKAEE